MRNAITSLSFIPLFLAAVSYAQVGGYLDSCDTPGLRTLPPNADDGRERGYTLRANCSKFPGGPRELTSIDLKRCFRNDNSELKCQLE